MPPRDNGVDKRVRGTRRVAAPVRMSPLLGTSPAGRTAHDDSRARLGSCLPIELGGVEETPPRHCASAPCGRGSTERYRERCPVWERSKSRASGTAYSYTSGRRKPSKRASAPPPNARQHCAADCAGDPRARSAHRVRSRGDTRLGTRIEKLSPCNTRARHDPRVAHVRAVPECPLGRLTLWTNGLHHVVSRI